MAVLIHLKIWSFTRLQWQATADLSNDAAFGEQRELITSQFSADSTNDASSTIPESSASIK